MYNTSKSRLENLACTKENIMEVIRKTVGPGVGLTAIRTEKFKSATLSVTFLVPLEEKTASLNALIPYVLRRGCEKYPTMAQVSRRLEELYGGMLEPTVRRRGETQCVGMMGSFLGDAYTLEDRSNLKEAGSLLAQLILHPATEAGGFRPEYVRGEKENLIQTIRGELNEKRQYAVLRLTQEMCRGERYGVDRYGSEETVRAVTPKSLWKQYQTLVGKARVELHYCGAEPVEKVEAALEELISGLCQGREGWEPGTTECQVVAAPPAGEPRRVVERLDVAQGKLALGFRTGGITLGDEDYPALMLCNTLYGGSGNSKLFLNVRERLSLCYYAGSMLESVKGLLVVSSGVEFGKLAEAEREILAQLESVKAGNITDKELEGARQILLSSYRGILDSRGALEGYWLTAAVTGVLTPPEELLEGIRRVTLREVAEAARKLRLDTVYQLVGKGVGENG